MIVPDVLQEGLSLVLCGTAPSRASKDAQSYYAHPGNIFWKTLCAVGLTPLQLSPSEHRKVVDFGIGLTDLNKIEWGADSELTSGGFDVCGFIAKMRWYRPAVIAFTSKHTASHYFSRKAIALGLQRDTLDGIPLFVLPSTSGRGRMYFDIRPWQELAGFVDRNRR